MLNQKLMKPLIVQLMVLCLCVACRVPPKYPTSLDEMQQALAEGIHDNQHVKPSRPIPSEVTEALMPVMPIQMPAAHKVNQRRFDVVVNNVPAKTFFMSLVKGTKHSMVVSPKVSGNITLHLKKVTIEEALQAVQDVYGYDYRKARFGYEILPNQLQTRMYLVNYIDVSRQGLSHTEMMSGQISEKVEGTFTGNGTLSRVQNVRQDHRSGGRVETKSNIDFWQKLQSTLASLVGDHGGRTVTVNPQAGLVVIKAYPDELRVVAQYLDSIQSRMDRQVILEAKILEVKLNNFYQAGIDWKILGARLNALQNTSFPGTSINNANFPSAFSTDINGGTEKDGMVTNRDFAAVIQALETQGNVQTLANPRVSTLNNQKAVIKSGQDEFFVTGISSTTTLVEGRQTVPAQDIQLTPFFSGIALDVTPQIDPQGGVTLHVHPSVSKVVDQNKKILLGQSNGNPNLFNLPLALSTVRESDTIVHAQSGQVIVIGGLIQHDTSEDIAAMPFLGRIPFIGAAFRNTKQTSHNRELVILLRPVVVEPDTWVKELRTTRERTMALQRGFHFGGRPDIFGTEAEHIERWGVHKVEEKYIK